MVGGKDLGSWGRKGEERGCLGSSMNQSIQRQAAYNFKELFLYYIYYATITTAINVMFLERVLAM